MAQTPAKSVANGDWQDYTAAAAVVAGDVIVVGSRAHPSPINLAASELGALPLEGIWDVPKATGSVTAGDAIYWDATGTPNVGDASSGAATKTSGSNAFMGYATAAAASGDTYVRVRLSDGPTTNAQPSLSVEDVAAAGSAQGDATAIGSSTGHAYCTGADGTKGVKLPTAVAGKMIFVKNDDAANAILKVYPATGDNINGLSANAAISMAAKTAAVFVCRNADKWSTFSLLPS